MKVQGIANWACVQTPNKKFDPTWQIDVTIDEKQAKELKKLGLTLKEDDKGNPVIKLKRAVMKKDGTPNQKPRVVDAKKQPFTDLVGNGSRVNAAFNVYEWNNNFGNGIAADLFAVQVLELVPYVEKDKDEFEEEDGFATEINHDDDLPFDEE